MTSSLLFALEVHPKNSTRIFRWPFLVFHTCLPNDHTATGHHHPSIAASCRMLYALSLRVYYTETRTLHSHDCATKQKTGLMMSAFLFPLLKCTQARKSRYTYLPWLHKSVSQLCHMATLRIDINTARLLLQVSYFTHSTSLIKSPQKSYSTM